MAQQKGIHRRVGPEAIYGEEVVKALETFVKTVTPLSRDSDIIYKNVLNAQSQALRVPVDRLRRLAQLLEEAGRNIEPLLRELKKRAAWAEEMQKHAARLSESLPRLTQKDIDRAVHQARRELYGGKRHPS